MTQVLQYIVSIQIVTNTISVVILHGDGKKINKILLTTTARSTSSGAPPLYLYSVNVKFEIPLKFGAASDVPLE